jgi:hypothetical protein
MNDDGMGSTRYKYLGRREVVHAGFSDKRSVSICWGGLEETMVQRLIPSGVAAAIAGTMAVALSCCPSFAQPVDYYGHPYHHYDNSYGVRHYVPKTNP